MIKKKKKCSSSGCPFNNKSAIDTLREKMVVEIHDVEELVREGQQLSACPYYATRAAIPLSQVNSSFTFFGCITRLNYAVRLSFFQLVVIPYNTLLHKSTREASKIKIKNNIVIIDEAHNLLDAIGNMHSSHVTGNQVINFNLSILLQIDEQMDSESCFCFSCAWVILN